VSVPNPGVAARSTADGEARFGARKIRVSGGGSRCETGADPQLWAAGQPTV